MQVSMRVLVVPLALVTYCHAAVSVSNPWASMKSQLSQDKDLQKQMTTLHAKQSEQEKKAPAVHAQTPEDKKAKRKHMDEELKHQMEAREAKHQIHSDGTTIKNQVQAVMSADQRQKEMMQRQLRERQARAEQQLKEKLHSKVAKPSTPSSHAPAKAVEAPATQRQLRAKAPEQPRAAAAVPKIPAAPVANTPRAAPESVVKVAQRELAAQYGGQPASTRQAEQASHTDTQPAAHVVVPAHDVEAPPPRQRKTTWKAVKEDNYGATARTVSGNPWKDVGGKELHSQVSEDIVEKEVEQQFASNNPGRLPKIPLSQPKKNHKEIMHKARTLAAHFSNDMQNFGAPAPAPGPAPGPVPWTEDPEWMIDGARGDKTKTAPIGEQFKGLASIPQPEQGFHGRPIVHEDMDSMVGDWQTEFGPAGPKSAFQICQDHPRSYWCRTHMKELEPAEEPYATHGADKEGGGVGSDNSWAIRGAFAPVAATLVAVFAL